MASILVKFVFDGDIRRTRIQTVSAAEVQAAAADAFPELPAGSFDIKYRDDEDDLCVLCGTTEPDFVMLYEGSSSLRLNVSKKLVSSVAAAPVQKQQAAQTFNTAPPSQPSSSPDPAGNQPHRDMPPCAALLQQLMGSCAAHCGSPGTLPFFAPVAKLLPELLIGQADGLAALFVEFAPVILQHLALAPTELEKHASRKPDVARAILEACLHGLELCPQLQDVHKAVEKCLQSECFEGLTQVALAFLQAFTTMPKEQQRHIASTMLSSIIPKVLPLIQAEVEKHMTELQPLMGHGFGKGWGKGWGKGCGKGHGGCSGWRRQLWAKGWGKGCEDSTSDSDSMSDSGFESGVESPSQEQPSAANDPAAKREAKREAKRNMKEAKRCHKAAVRDAKQRYREERQIAKQHLKAAKQAAKELAKAGSLTVGQMRGSNSAPATPASTQLRSDATDAQVFNFPVVVGDGRHLNISWRESDDHHIVAKEFAVEHGIADDELPTILSFLAHAESYLAAVKAAASTKAEATISNQSHADQHAAAVAAVVEAHRQQHNSAVVEAQAASEDTAAMETTPIPDAPVYAFVDQLESLEAMGFGQRDLNVQLLSAHDGNLDRVLEQLL